ncbi:MAG: site-2 protease family protein [Clostridia bacterium]
MLFNALSSLLTGGNIDIMSIVAQILSILFVVIFILPLHEYAHGIVAYKLGDPTPKYDRRLTLNPLASIDPVGSMALLIFGYGWAKPVQVNPRNFKNPKRDMAIVAVAGPLSNVLAALVGQIILSGMFAFNVITSYNSVAYFIAIILSSYVSINLSLAAFNLIPMPPLDGSRIIGAFLSDNALYKYYSYQRYFTIIFIVLMFSGVLSVPLSFVWNILYNAVSFVAEIPFMFI